MFRALRLGSLCAAFVWAAPVAAAPREAPLTEQSAILHYEVQVTGRRDGQTIDDSIVVSVPAWAQQSLPANIIGPAKASELSAAPSLASQEAGFAEANRLLDAVMAACAPDQQSAACKAAQGRLKAHEERAGAATAVADDDADQHRYLAFVAGPGATVETSYNHGGRKGVARYTAPAGTIALNTAVIDRRDGAVALDVTLWGFKDVVIGADGAVTGDLRGDIVGDFERLRGLPGVLEVNPMTGTARFPLQPSAGAAGDYAGSMTVTGNGLRWVIRWRVEWPPKAS